MNISPHTRKVFDQAIFEARVDGDERERVLNTGIRGHGHEHSRKRAEIMHRMKNMGVSYVAIAECFGCHHSTVHDAIRRFKARQSNLQGANGAD